MTFHQRQYTVFLLLAGPDAPELWQAPLWSCFADDLREFACTARGKAAVRTLQYATAGKPVAFGRLGWDEKSAARWTHAPGNDERLFAHLEAWTPSWNQCERDRLAPDFFFSMANDRMPRTAGRPLRFGQQLICAIAQDMGAGKAAALQAVLARWAVELQSPLLAFQARPWGFASGTGFTGAIQDMVITGAFKPGDPHARAIDAASLSEEWTVIPRA